MEETKKSPFTDEQLKIIDDKGNNLIVSAAAGSGKTTVMIERIARIIDKQKVPITNILVVTFTNASSIDMKAKLVKKLSQLEPSPYILEQIENVAVADVSTLHSFCAKLLKTYFYEAGVDPTFVVLSEQESNTLKQKALSLLFDQKYDEQDAGFYTLLDSLQQNRNDGHLKSTILKMFDFFNVVLDKQSWFEKGLKELYSTNLNTNYGANLINNYVAGRIEKLREKISEKIDRFNQLGIPKYVEFLQNMDSAIATVNKHNNFETNAKNIFEMKNFGKIPSIKNLPEPIKNEFEAFRDYIKKEKDNFKNNYISEDKETLIQELLGAKELSKNLYNATLQFAQIYSDLKKEKCGLDYNDLEQYTLKVLENSEILNTIKSKYKYVFVDEYQDINSVQEKMISLISGKNNRFMVGDVKQSIYGFRLCDPNIFLKKYNEYLTSANSKAHTLSKNFRSNKNILNFVNKVFEGRMTKDFGDVDYSKEKLEAGKNFEQEEPVELCYLDTNGLKEYYNETQIDKNKVYSVKEHHQEKELENLEQIAQAQYIATQINDLVANKQITIDENNNKQEIKYKDIAILVRARNKFLTTLTSVFDSHKIPYSTDLSINLLDNKYVKSLYNFLKLIYDDKQDIELFSVLYSPMTDLTLNDITFLRVYEPDCKFFYQSVDNILADEQINANIKQKISNFMQKLNKYKNVAKYKTIKQLAKIITQDFDFEEMILCEANGKQNLSLFDKFIKSLPETNVYSYFVDNDISEIQTENPVNTNAVQIMTIHSSKGLEFPVVFVANVERNFSPDSNGSVVFSKEHGVATEYYNNVDRYKSETIASEAIKVQGKKGYVEEEQRLLYVALTRAINKLYVVATCDINKINEEFVERPQSFLNWFDPMVSEYLKTKQANGYSVSVENAENYVDMQSFAANKQVVFGKEQNKFTQLIKDSLAYSYANINGTQENLKTSVTEIASGYHESEEVYQKYKNIVASSSTQKGNAYHRFMQYIDFGFTEKKQLDEYSNKLLNSGILDKQEIGLIDNVAILKLLELQDFKNIVANGNILREQEFFMNISQDNDVQILQGVIDLAIIKPDGTAIIADYKTGNFASKQNLAKYSKQISLYAQAFEKAYSVKVTRKIIIAIEQAKMFDI